MKNLFTLFLVVITTTSLFAQKNKKFYEDRENTFRLGAKAGVNINKITGEGFNDKFSYNYLLGGFVQWNFSRRFGLQPELNFAQSSAEVADDANTIYDDLFLGGSQKKAKLNYIKVPILLNMDIGQSQRIKLQLGPQWSILKKKHDELSDRGNRLFKDGDFSVLGGLWIQLPVVNIGARYEVGLSKIGQISNSDKWKSQAIQVFAGITL